MHYLLSLIFLTLLFALAKSQDYPNDEFINMQVRMDPGSMGSFMHPLISIFNGPDSAFDSRKDSSSEDRENWHKKENSTDGLFYEKTILTAPKHMVIRTKGQDGYECPFLCSLFGPMFGPSGQKKTTIIEGKDDQNSTTEFENGSRMTFQVHKSKNLNSEELDKDLERVENSLQKVLHNIENSFSRIFQSRSNSKNNNSTTTEPNILPTPIPTEETFTEKPQMAKEEPKLPESEPVQAQETSEKIQDLEKKLSQVLGMVEKLENENNRLKKVLTNIINGT